MWLARSSLGEVLSLHRARLSDHAFLVKLAAQENLHLQKQRILRFGCTLVSHYLTAKGTTDRSFIIQIRSNDHGYKKTGLESHVPVFVSKTMQAASSQPKPRRIPTQRLAPLAQRIRRPVHRSSTFKQAARSLIDLLDIAADFVCR